MTNDLSATQKMTSAMRSGVASLFSRGGSGYTLTPIGGENPFKGKQSQDIIIDYLSLGRGTSCPYPYTKDLRVSRLHAAIKREGDQYNLINLSETNQTILNGRPVSREYVLRNGDEIELSNGGPKLQFHTRQSSGVNNNTGLTSRIKLFQEQALRPYKTAVTILSVLIAGLIAFSGYMSFELIQYQRELAKAKSHIADLKDITAAQMDMWRMENDSLKKKEQMARDSFTIIKNVEKAEIQKMKKEQAAQVALFQKKIDEFKPMLDAWDNVNNVWGKASNKFLDTANVRNHVVNLVSLNETFEDIYTITLDKITVKYFDERTIQVPLNISGTAFVTKNGYVLTSRSVIEPWAYRDPADKQEFSNFLVTLNVMINNAGTDSISCSFTLKNSKGKIFNMHSADFTCDKSEDRNQTLNGKIFIQGSDALNIAWGRSPVSGRLTFDNQNIDLAAGTAVYIVGYPYAAGVSAVPTESIDTILSAGDKIITGHNAFNFKESGAPAFVIDGAEPKVIGVVAKLPMIPGFIVPIKNFKPNN